MSKRDRRVITYSLYPNTVKERPSPCYNDADAIPQYQYQINVVNTTTKKVMIANRSGLNSIINSVPKETVKHRLWRHMDSRGRIETGIYITVKTSQQAYKYAGMRDDILDARCKLNDDKNPYFVQMAESYTQLDDKYKEGSYVVQQFFVSETELDNHGDPLYLPEVDLLITTNLADDLLPHLFSHEGRDASLANIPNPTITRHASGINIMNVDNSGRVGDLYYQLLDRVWRVRPVKNPLLEDGVHFYTTGDTDEAIKLVDENTVDPNITRISHKDALEGLGPIKLYATEKEARLEIDQQRLKIQEVEYKQRQQAHEEKLFLQKAEFEYTRHQQKMEESREEAKVNQRRYEYEERRERRKDFSDFLKNGMAVLTGIVAAAVSTLKILEKVLR